MKNFKKFLFLGIFTSVLMGVWSCSNTENVPIDNSITGIATRSNDLSILVDALNRTGLTETLRTGGPFTVFAPSNTAFQNLLTTIGASSLNDIPNQQLKEILLNHVVSGSVLSGQLNTGYIKTLATPSASTSNMMSMYVNTSVGVKLNGVSNVTTPNVLASNGVVHVVDAVITLPTVVTFALADPNFSILVAALTRDDQAPADFVNTLSGDGPFTVFAPLDAAFVSLLAELGLNELSNVPGPLLTEVLKYHVVAGANVLSSTLTNNQNVITFQGQPLTINISASGASITDARNRISNIVAVDVQANNGVIHALDKVILPAE